MTDFPIDPNAAPLGFVVNPANGQGMATGGNTPQSQLVQVGWYCWRCEGLVEQPCRSDNVPVSVPAEWAGDMEAEIRRLGEEDDDAETTTRVFAALHQSAEQDVTRVIGLYERWVKAGPPPLGTTINRWWDQRLAELHRAIQPAAGQSKEQP